jgi:excinuclease ABC subunit B
VGINLLREGLDLPEVALVCIMDADKEGFLRNERSLIQTIGRAARNADGHVILYADRITDGMKLAIGETERRRSVQQAWNQRHGIVPTTVVREIGPSLADLLGNDAADSAKRGASRGKSRGAGAAQSAAPISAEALPSVIDALRKEMKTAATALEFERAAELRDRIKVLEQQALGA